MPKFPPIFMPLIFLALLLLPVKLSSQGMKMLAFLLWLTGGVFLTAIGAFRLIEAQPEPWLAAVLIATALVIGTAKGKFVLSKTSARNLERIDAFTQSMPPIRVYSARSWIVIAIMVGISLLLTVLHAPDLVRGTINLGIGCALAVSSLVYLKAFSPNKSASI